MKNHLKYILILTLAFSLFNSCEEDGYEDFTVEKTGVIELSGDWYVETFLEGNKIIDYEVITTSNTANDNSAIQIFDHEHIWTFNVAVPANSQNLTFEGSGLASDVDGYEITVDITNGKVEKNATVTSGTNLPADLISFDAEFSDDPGNVYHIEGYKRSGYLEDEH
ncbi:lipid-binding protein [Flavivirga sp. 57AJ16]|uniref:lipid-binding protein n=1 Tax=Flavivirga sp. 57AJ16 TaxID=3025307 RepID=UPI0023653F1B|nr:lipid-binding protein [Flavivirga sp. 57AJ16]MDD7886425.1 lipid-binding protein [Flavivirga sp. 57AJ16]